MLVWSTNQRILTGNNNNNFVYSGCQSYSQYNKKKDFKDFNVYFYKIRNIFTGRGHIQQKDEKKTTNKASQKPIIIQNAYEYACVCEYSQNKQIQRVQKLNIPQ